MPDSSIRDFLQAEIQRLGFLLSGITRAAPPPHYATYQKWIEAGLHAGMTYLAAERALERRARPALILPEATAMLVVALPYFNPQAAPASSTGEAAGRVAAYAWGNDYHDIIPPRLAELLANLEKFLGRGLHARSYTDTGPLLERDFAQQAGLGWSGKNTCLISPRHGSYFLLGETLLDVCLLYTSPSPRD